MGFSFHYISMSKVSDEQTSQIDAAVTKASAGYSWLSCEPPLLTTTADGYLIGSSKPTFNVHPDDAKAATEVGQPDGTVFTLLDILCELSAEFKINWQIGHDYSDGTIGTITDGECDSRVQAQFAGFSELIDVVRSSDEFDDLGDEFDIEPSFHSDSADSSPRKPSAGASPPLRLFDAGEDEDSDDDMQ